MMSGCVLALRVADVQPGARGYGNMSRRRCAWPACCARAVPCSSQSSLAKIWIADLVVASRWGPGVATPPPACTPAAAAPLLRGRRGPCGARRAPPLPPSSITTIELRMPSKLVHGCRGCPAVRGARPADRPGATAGSAVRKILGVAFPFFSHAGGDPQPHKGKTCLRSHLESREVHTFERSLERAKGCSSRARPSRRGAARRRTPAPRRCAPPR